MRWTKRKENGNWPAGVPRACIPIIGKSPPPGPHEIKHDGYRLMVQRDGASVRIFTRGGYDCTERYPAIAAAARRLPSKRFLIDGEGVVEGENGVADWALLHSRKHGARCYLIDFGLIEVGSAAKSVRCAVSALPHTHDIADGEIIDLKAACEPVLAVQIAKRERAAGA